MVFLYIIPFVLNVFAGINRDRIEQFVSKKSKAEWFQCKDDSECMFVMGPCSVAIASNIKSGKFVRKAIDSIPRKEKVCVDLKGEKHPSRAKCVRERCEVSFGE